jgi:hypothetical protein
MGHCKDLAASRNAKVGIVSNHDWERVEELLHQAMAYKIAISIEECVIFNE